jgi:hypothetical protein
MAIVKPFVTPKFTAYAGDVLIAKVLLALRLVDDFLRLEDVNAIQQGREKRDFNRENPLGDVDIEINGPREISVVKNNSGFYCVVLFEADPGKTYDGTYTVVIDADENLSDRYLKEELGIVIKDGKIDKIIQDNQDQPAPNPKAPVVEVILKPKPAYPFPENTTLVRGIATFPAGTGSNTKDTPVVDALVTTTFQQLQFDSGEQDYKPKPKTIATKTDRNGEFVMFFKKVAQKTQQIEVKAQKNGDAGKIIPPGIKTLKEGSITRANFEFSS